MVEGTSYSYPSIESERQRYCSVSSKHWAQARSRRRRLLALIVGRAKAPAPNLNLSAYARDGYRKEWLVLRIFLSLLTPKQIRFSERA